MEGALKAILAAMDTVLQTELLNLVESCYHLLDFLVGIICICLYVSFSQFGYTVVQVL